MNGPVEPKWPTRKEIWEQTPLTGSIAGTALDLCRAAWLAANDDPSTDLPGTVRTSPDGVVVVRDDVAEKTGIETVPPWHITWAGRNPYRKNALNISDLTNADVVGWKRGTPVDGTPAAKAAGK